MARLPLREHEVAIRDTVGVGPLLAARALVAAGHVQQLSTEGDGLLTGLVGGEGVRHQTHVQVALDSGGLPITFEGRCTCSPSARCTHAVALVLARHGGGQAWTARRPAAWELALGRLSAVGDDNGPPSPDDAEVALQFQVRGADVEVRPVLRGRGQAWVRSGISWPTVPYHSGYQHRGRSGSLLDKHVAVLRDLLALLPSHSYLYGSAGLSLRDIRSRGIWDVLAHGAQLGLPLVYADRAGTPVLLHHRPATPRIEVTRGDDGLVLVPRLFPNQAPVEGTTILLGDPAHGVALHDGGSGLRLAPIDGVLDEDLAALLLGGELVVPAHDEDRFLHRYYPTLTRRLRVTTVDPTVELPQAAPPVLLLTVRRTGEHSCSVVWQWRYWLGAARQLVGTETAGMPARMAGRDLDAEQTILAGVRSVLATVPELVSAGGQAGGPPDVELSGMSTVRFLEQVVPALQARSDVDVVLDVDPARAGDGWPAYREVDQAPSIVFGGGADSSLNPDWFDLAVNVRVGEQEVPFEQLFLALARGDEHLILSNGTWFSLDRPEYVELRQLIVEARSLEDAPPGTLRLTRFHASQWEELDRLGIVEGQAAQWQRSVKALTDADDRPAPSTPAGVRAQLRPYQSEGFAWLAALHDLGLGGILADDMGLGKTLQTLALICHVIERRDDDEPRVPFLVVAPTSVVHTWAAEAARFAPDLRVAVVTETQARRGVALAEVHAEVDLVVTSYTLFRLEYDDYHPLGWAGLVLDEAQFVKNHQSRTYACAKKLPAPTKLAITGTPLENTLMELWALLSITAPGLFAHAQRFTEYYRWPIERDCDGDRLALLRRRIAPLLLRRTKDQVAADLPDKQEQVVELELLPRHRVAYQKLLQRERQKVLGLLGDLERNRFAIFRSLTLLRQASLDMSLVEPRQTGIPSTKLDAFEAHVAELVGEGHRVLVFSQFTRFLESARQRLVAQGIETCTLDGTTRNRGAVIDRFRSGSAAVFLISLKAGGFGLTLTEADYCILLDPWWNPASEAQAVDRAHRIGQTKKVMVYRFVAKDTIEEKVMALKAAKGALFDGVLGGEELASSALGAREIRELLA